MQTEMFYLDFQKANCKNCYKCLRYCPVKAIDMRSSQAKIIEDRCILCGHCTVVCPQNTKRVHDDTESILKLLAGKKRVVASVAPSFVSSFSVGNFESFRAALKQLGFFDAFETAEGAVAVTAEYKKLLETGKYPNLITSACPAVNRAIRLYHHDMLKYLAPVDSPMVAHAKILKSRYDCEVVFIGPCIAKKREAKESGIIAGALTFDQLAKLFENKSVCFAAAVTEEPQNTDLAANSGVSCNGCNASAHGTVKTSGKIGDSATTLDVNAAAHGLRSKFYPIPRGIIKTFDSFPCGYEYIAVDGVERLDKAIEDLKNIRGVFLEINACEGGCVSGPCSIQTKGGAVEANVKVREYANRTAVIACSEYPELSVAHTPLDPGDRAPSEQEIESVLQSTGKHSKGDELNCGACGFSTCREKAWAVINGHAELEMCVPYMREKAESMSNVIIENSPNGLIVCDTQLKIGEINRRAESIVGMDNPDYIFDCFDPTEVFKAAESGTTAHISRMKLDKTGKYVDINVVPLKKENALLIVLTDVTDRVNYDAELVKVKRETLTVTDTVIVKQMRVAQEIASLLGETTAETKTALLKLKDAMLKEKE